MLDIKIAHFLAIFSEGEEGKGTRVWCQDSFCGIAIFFGAACKAISYHPIPYHHYLQQKKNLQHPI